MKLLALAALGGGIGSALRYIVVVAIAKIAPASFPFPILTINIIGSFSMGLLVAALALKLSESLEMRTFLGAGILGGFTTFSAFSLDFMSLMQRKDVDLAMLYVGASVGLSLLAIYAGVTLGRALWA